MVYNMFVCDPAVIQLSFYMQHHILYLEVVKFSFDIHHVYVLFYNTKFRGYQRSMKSC